MAQQQMLLRVCDRCGYTTCDDVLYCRACGLPLHREEDVYRDVALKVAELVVKKQQAYGDSFGKAAEIFKVLYPDGIPVEAYQDALAVVRIVDKLFRIATDKQAFNENPWEDVMGYALLSTVKGGSKND